MRLSKRRKPDYPEFSPDSAEQITESMDRTGLRHKLHQAVQAAIARADRSKHNSNHPTIDEPEEVELADEALLK